MTEVTVHDHTDPSWARLYERAGRENGAATYSRDIVAHHLPAWRAEFERVGAERALVGTCARLLRPVPPHDIAVQYLHAYSYRDPLKDVDMIRHALLGSCDRVVFVAAVAALVNRINRTGGEAVRIPPAIRTADVRAAADPRLPRLEGRAVYFGNITTGKRPVVNPVLAAVRAGGYEVDVLSFSQLNGRGPVLTQEEAWRQVARYDVGIGVGRCALEMMALGLPVIIAGHRFGGIITSDAEFDAQSAGNFNGSVVTYSDRPEECVAAIGSALRGRTTDTAEAVAVIPGILG